MNWESIEAFVAMGGYGLYVWGSYTVTVALLAAECFALVNRRRLLLQLWNKGQTQ